MWDHPKKNPTGNMLNIDLGMTGDSFLEITMQKRRQPLSRADLFVQGLLVQIVDVDFLIWERCVCLNANA